MFKGHRDSVLDLTITFPQENGVALDTLDTQRRLKPIRPHLDRLFPYWFLVLEPDGNGNPHYQGAAVAPRDIRRGWNQAAWEKMQRGESTDAQPLTYNRRLVKIWSELRQHIPGRTTVTPIMSAKAVIDYTTKKLHVPSSEWNRFKRGTQWVHCSKSLGRVVASTRFCWNTLRCRLARQKKSAIAAALQISPQRCRELIGPRWYRRMSQWIAALDAQWPGWHESAPDALESLAINTLAALDLCWAESLAFELSERRDRRMRGLNPDEPEPQPDPCEIVRQDMERAAQWRAALQSLTPA